MGSPRVTLLGGFDVRLAPGGTLSLPTKKAQALLAYLGLRPGQPHQREKLAALLWGGRRDEQARDGLRHAIAALRKALPRTKPPILLVDGPTLALNPAAVEVDVVTFERLITKGTVESLENAAGLYRGDLLLGFSLEEPLFEDWLVVERERLREMALEGLARLLARQTQTAATERAIQTGVRLLALDPLQEAVHRTLMQLYARQGRRGAALKQYQTCVAALQRELGAEPEAKTRELYLELLRQRAPADRARPARRAARTRVDLLTGETPLFGRETQLGRLRELLEDAAHGRAHVAIVTGEAGVGKTRLLATLATEAVDRDFRVLVGRGHESEAILPFGPWVDAFRAGDVGPDEEAITALSATWRAELSRLLPDVASPGLPPPSDSDLRLFESVAQLVEHMAARRPVVLLLEDLHWADEMSLRLLAFISRRVRGWAGLLLASVREEELADAALARRILGELSRQSQTVSMSLAPLSRPDVTCLVQALARAGTARDEMAQLDAHVWVVSEGNPLAAIETIRAIEDGLIGQGSSSLPLPQRVRELVIGRLERLSDQARQLAAVAAVIGREFDFPLVQQAVGLDDIPAAEAVEELVRRRIFRGTGERLDFTHDRIRAAVSEDLVPPLRQLLHRRVGEAIETLHAGDLERHSLALGVHFRQGEVWDKAVGYLRQAGVRAMARAANREAVAYLEQALGALDRLPPTRATTELTIDLRIDLRNALRPLGDRARMGEHLHAADVLARRLGDQHRLARIATFTVIQCLDAGAYDEAVRSGQEALSLARTLGDRAIEVAATMFLGMTHGARGELSVAATCLAQNVAALQGDLRYERFGTPQIQSAVSAAWLADMLSQLGRFEEAIGHAEDAVQTAETANHPYTLYFGLFDLGRAHLRRGDPQRAIPVLERTLELCRTWQIVVGIPVAAAALGTAYALAGRADEARPLVAEALEQFRQRPLHNRPAFILLCAATAALWAGHLDEAHRHAAEALALARRLGARGSEAHALCLAGDVAVAGDAEAAAGYYREALTLAGELDLRPVVAHCHLGLGKLSRRTGGEPRAQFATATTLYREMGMPYWLERAEEELE